MKNLIPRFKVSLILEYLICCISGLYFFKIVKKIQIDDIIKTTIGVREIIHPNLTKSVIPHIFTAAKTAKKENRFDKNVIIEDRAGF